MLGRKKLKKGRMGYVLDLRQAIGRLKVISEKWCQAFDVGDDDAMEVYNVLLTETFEDVTTASSGVTATFKGD